MRQHSGTWACAAIIPLATTAFSLCISFAERGAPTDLDRANGGLNFSSRQLKQPDESLATATPFAATPSTATPSTATRTLVQSGYVLSVPRNALIVVGSLDLSGTPHIVAVDAARRGFESLSCRLPDSHQAVLDCCRLSSSDITLPNELDAVGHNLLSPHASDFIANRSGDPKAATLPVPDPISIRRFLVPHFEQEMSVNEVGNATLIAHSPRVSVYLDHSLCKPGTLPADLAVESPETQCAVEVCRRLETGLLDHVSIWIGPVADLDGDQRLTVVITDLDRRKSLPDAPVLGCVRDRDFLRHHEADLSGDILYLDRGIPEGNSLDALLVHELTHAAVFSLMLNSQAGMETECGRLLPSWLNEATAHLVECSLAGGTTSLDQRVRQFHADPSACPIVASESHLPFWARRGGSRASATIFLQQFAGTPDALRSLIESHEPIDRRLESMTGRPFRQVFRIWSAGQAQMAERFASAPSGRFAANRAGFSQRVFGTAFFCFRCEEPVADLQVVSDNEAELQITVIE